MTAWQSMFDGGDCYVEVRDGIGSVPPDGGFSDYLAKGQTSPGFFLNQDEATYTIGVDANGVVTLASDDSSATPINVAVTVYPDYDVSQRKTQAKDISITSGQGTPWNSGGSTASSGDGAAATVLADSTAPTTPSFVEFAPYPPPQDTGAYLSVIGGGVG